MKISDRIATIAAVGLLYCGVSAASTILFSGSQDGRSASVEFNYTSDNQLMLTIQNLAPGSIVSSADLLTGVYFSLSNPTPVTLTPESGALAPTSTFLNGTAPLNVGGNWGYAVFASEYNTTTQGVSATGMGAGFFGDGNFGCVGAGCKHLNGADYGLAPALYPADANPALSRTPVIQSGVTLTFSNVSSQPLVQNVWFQYGSALGDGGFYGTPDEPLPGPVPEPGAIVLTSIGLACVGIGMRYRRNRA